ncbi:hypothetical protein DIPPA_13655 [Diplonema papillatum]|nr:hypothetical protein DIPPA_13655 [Diplonema papillatum]|eukprot:gene11419-17569_t
MTCALTVANTCRGESCQVLKEIYRNTRTGKRVCVDVDGASSVWEEGSPVSCGKADSRDFSSSSIGEKSSEGDYSYGPSTPSSSEGSSPLTSALCDGAQFGAFGNVVALKQLSRAKADTKSAPPPLKKTAPLKSNALFRIRMYCIEVHKQVINEHCIDFMRSQMTSAQSATDELRSTDDPTIANSVNLRSLLLQKEWQL